VREVKQLYDEATRKFADDGTPHTKHVNDELIIEVDEEAGTATCRSYFSVFQQTPDLPLQPTCKDAIRTASSVWTAAGGFKHRHMITDLVGNLSQHLLRDIKLK